jgi:outer membrane immunogenic protein
MTIKTKLAATAVLLITSAPAFAGSLAAPTMSAEVYSPPAANAYKVMTEQAVTWDGLYVGASAGYAGQSGIDGSGLGLGLHAGYNLDMGTMVVGAEVAYAPFGQELDNNAGEMTGAFSAKLKAGYDAGDFLPYATVGMKHAKADLSAGSASGTGMTYGVGVDYMLTDSIILGGELSQAKFSDFDGNGTDLSQTSVDAKVSFKF